MYNFCACVIDQKVIKHRYDLVEIFDMGSSVIGWVIDQKFIKHITKITLGPTIPIDSETPTALEVEFDQARHAHVSNLHATVG